MGVGDLQGYHPQTCLGALVSTDYCSAAIFNGAIDFSEGHFASRVAHGDNGEKGVGREAGDDVQLVHRRGDLVGLRCRYA